MAKKATTKPARSETKPKKARPTRSKAAGTARSRSSASIRKKRSSDMSAADALSGILESPLVAEVIAAGAAAALATLTQQALSKKAQGGTADALKQAAKAAAAAMGTRLATEFDEIVESAKKASAESR